MTIDVLKTIESKDSKCVTNLVPTIRRTSGVRRSLFGPVDHNECLNFIKKELHAIEESQKKKWSFDFTEEKPLDSTEYEWTPVKSDELIPKPYALGRLPYLYEHTENSPCKEPSRLPSQPSESQKVTKFKQTSMDGYVKRKKRSATILKNDSCCSCDRSKNQSQCTCYHPKSKKLCNDFNSEIV